MAATMRTDIGKKRKQNEDAAWFDEKRGVFVVADGMGGHLAGEVASGMAIDAVRKMAARHKKPSIDQIKKTVLGAHERIYQRAQGNAECAGMGTTLSMLCRGAGYIYIAHVGDSRIYRLRGGRMEQLTQDHSLVGELVRAGILTAEEARTHPRRNIITRALGSDPEMYADHFTLDVENGDRVIICSDGLSSMVPDSLIEDLAISSAMPQQAADNLVAEALAQGGHDNVTVIVIDVTDDGSRAIRRRRRRRTVFGWLASLAVVCALAAAASMLFVLNSWYVGANGGYVAIYRGVQGNFLGISTSSLAESTTISLGDLPESTQHSLERGIGVSSLEEAERTVDDYRDQIDAEKTRAAAAAGDAKAQGADTETAAVQTAAAPTTKPATTTTKAGE